MYCMQCGIRLAGSEEKCPLCHLRVYHPDLSVSFTPKPYPPFEKTTARFSKSGKAILLTALFAIALIFTFVCNLRISQNVSWWKYVAESVLLAYIVCVLPMWFRHVMPLIFVFVDFVALGGFLVFLNLFTGGNWFLSFAFPVLGGVALIVCTVMLLVRFLHRGYFFVYGGAMIAAGAFMLLVEFLLDYTFGFPLRFAWSLYALTAWCLVGAFLLLVGFCRPLRRALSKRFFL